MSFIFAVFNIIASFFPCGGKKCSEVIFIQLYDHRKARYLYPLQMHNHNPPKPQCTDALNPVNNPEKLFQWLFFGLLCQHLDKYLDASLWTMSPLTSVTCLSLGSRTRFYYQEKLRRSAGQRKTVGTIVTEAYILIKELE